MKNATPPGGERFTLWLNSDSPPVVKSLAEMTTGEVVALGSHG